MVNDEQNMNNCETEMEEDREETYDIMRLSEKSFEEWDNEEDAVYDSEAQDAL